MRQTNLVVISPARKGRGSAREREWMIGFRPPQVDQQKLCRRSRRAGALKNRSDETGLRVGVRGTVISVFVRQ
jgi:hypothetical protein